MRVAQTTVPAGLTMSSCLPFIGSDLPGLSKRLLGAAQERPGETCGRDLRLNSGLKKNATDILPVFVCSLTETRVGFWQQYFGQLLIDHL